MLRRRIILAVKLTIAAVLIAWLLGSGRIRWSDVAQMGSGWPWFVAALAPFGLVLVLCAQRWRLFLRAQGIKYSFREAFALTMVGHFFNQFLIGTTGGDMVKAYAIATEVREKRGAAVMSVFVDRVMGLIVLVAVSLAAIGFNLEKIRAEPRLLLLATVSGTGFALCLIAGYLFYSERVRASRPVRWLLARIPFPGALAQLTGAVYVYKYHPREVALTIGISVAVQVLVVLMHILLACALAGTGVTWATFFFLIPVAEIAMAIPINPPGAIGTGEWIYATLLPFAGVPQGAVICLFQRLVYYVWAVPACVYYLRRKATVRRAVAAARASEESHGNDQGPDCAGGVGAAATEPNRNRSVRPRVDTGAPSP